MAGSAASTDLLFDPSAVRRLSTVYSDCFALILQLRATEDFGPPDTLRARLKELLQEAERAAQGQGISAAETRSASFALVSFIDETILSSNWQHKESWLTDPLQKERYDRTDAGEEFFSRVEEMLRHPQRDAEVLEVYYLCMTLGFKGKYQLHSQGQLRALIETIREQLRKAPGFTAATLAPHGTPEDQAAAAFKSRLPTWVVLALAGALALVIYVAMTFYIESVANSAAESIEAVAYMLS